MPLIGKFMICGNVFQFIQVLRGILGPQDGNGILSRFMIHIQPTRFFTLLEADTPFLQPYHLAEQVMFPPRELTT